MKRWSVYRDRSPFGQPVYLSEVTAPDRAAAVLAGEIAHGKPIVAQMSTGAPKASTLALETAVRKVVKRRPTWLQRKPKEVPDA